MCKKRKILKDKDFLNYCQRKGKKEVKLLKKLTLLLCIISIYNTKKFKINYINSKRKGLIKINS